MEDENQIINDLIVDNHCINQSKFKIGDEVWVNFRTFSHLPPHGRLGIVVGFYRQRNETIASGTVIRIETHVIHSSKNGFTTKLKTDIKDFQIAFEHLILEKANTGKIISKWLSNG